MWWYDPVILLALLPAGGTGPSDISSSDSAALTESSATATLAAVPVDSWALSESAIATLVVNSIDSGNLNDATVSVTSGNLISSSETFTLTDSFTSLVAAVVMADTATLSEAVASIPLSSVAADNAALSESIVGTAAVVATDTAAITEVGTGSLISGANISDSELSVLTEAVSISVVSSGADSFAAADVIVPVGVVAQNEQIGLSETAAGFAPLFGVPEAAVRLAPRVQVQDNAGVPGWTWDSTYVKFDSTLFTFDGGYLGQVAGEGIALEPKLETESALEERMDALMGVGT